MIQVINVNKKLFYENTRDSHLTELRVSTLIAFRIHPPPLHALIFKSPKKIPRVFLKAVIFIGLSPVPIYIRSVWIWFILLKLKTYYWNYCSKIIFKCVNSIVGSIFNEKIDKKWNLWVRKQCTDALFTEKKSTFVITVYWTVAHSLKNAWKQKKKKTKKQNANVIYETWIQTET